MSTVYPCIYNAIYGAAYTPMDSPYTGFSPSNLSGLAIWLDAQDITTFTKNGSNLVSQWNDKSGNNNHAVQATGVRQPLYVQTGINSRPAVEGRHDGSNASQLTVADASSLNYTEFSVFIAGLQHTNLGATAQLFGKYATTGNMREHRITIGATAQCGGGVSPDGTATGNSVPFISSPTVTVDTLFLLDMTFRAGGAGASLTLNNTTNSTSTTATSVFNGTATYDFFSRESTFTDAFAGRIGEFLFFNRALSAIERTNIINYLYAKWN